MQLTRAFIFLNKLRADTSGTSMLEFALGLPLVLAMGGYGAELSNYAIVTQRVNQAVLGLADNASRVGANSSSKLSVFQLREGDMNDVLQGVRLTGNSIGLTTNGRITISSLENIKQDYDNAPVQRIHWQRCVGLKTGADYESHYGTATITAGSDATQTNAGTTMAMGMGDTGSEVNAPSGTGVIFVEVNYQYQPLFGNIILGDNGWVPAMMPTRIHFTASFIIRDNRDFTQMYNPSPTAAASTCDLHTV